MAIIAHNGLAEGCRGRNNYKCLFLKNLRFIVLQIKVSWEMAHAVFEYFSFARYLPEAVPYRPGSIQSAERQLSIAGVEYHNLERTGAFIPVVPDSV